MILILILSFPSTALAASVHPAAGYKTGFYYPWANSKKAEVTQGKHEGGALDFVIGTLNTKTTPLADRTKQLVTAAKDGVIEFVRDDSRKWCNYDKGQQCYDDTNLVVIKHPGNGNNPTTYSWYLHLAANSVPDELKKGMTIRQGEVIGKQGNSGTISPSGDPGQGYGTHLHFMVTSGYKAPVSTQKLPRAASLISDFVFVDGQAANQLTKGTIKKSTNTPNSWAQFSNNGYCLDLTDGTSKVGDKIQVYKCGSIGSTNQKWQINVLAPGTYSLKAPITNEWGHSSCLDVTDGNPDNPVQVWDCVSGNDNQTWQIVPVSNGIYQLRSKTHKVCASVESYTNRARVLLKTCNAKDTSQIWGLKEIPRKFTGVA